MNKSSDADSRIVFQCGKNQGDIFLDNISLRQIITAQTEQNTLHEPDTFEIQSHPNPFNNETVIAYSTGEPGRVELFICNIKGERIRSLLNHRHENGHFKIKWDGRNDAAESMENGMYIIIMHAGRTVQSHKCLLIK